MTILPAARRTWARTKWAARCRITARGNAKEIVMPLARQIRGFSNTKDTSMVSIVSMALLINAIAAGQQPPAAPAPEPVPAVLQNYQPVTAERLKSPEDRNWLMIRRTYDGWGYSPLDQITPANVSRLRPVWVFSTGEGRVHEAAPIVNNGVMFVSTPNNQVIAIDARTGNLLWRYKRIRPAGAAVPHDTSRGVALYGDKVLYA